MKNVPSDLIKNYFRDRTLFSLTAVLFLVVVVYSVYVGLSLEQSDLQVATRYTAFGNTHFYRNKWYYLLSFIVFGAVIMATHTALAIKLYGRQQRQLAVGLLVLTLLLIGIGWLITRSVLQIAFL